MDNLFFWAILAIVVSAIGSLVWWGLVIFGIFKGAKYLNRQFEQQLQGMEALNRQWAQMSPQQRAAQQAQLGPSFSLLNQRLSQLDSISRQRYVNRVGELMGLAGSAGIDWHP